MPRPAEWAEHECAELRTENDKLKRSAEIQRAALANSAAGFIAERKLNEELMDTNQVLRGEIEKLKADMDERMQAYVAAQEKDEATIAARDAFIAGLRKACDELRAERAGDQQRLFHYEGVIARHGEVHADNILTMQRMTQEGALIVHALDSAIALTEQLFIFLPEGMVLPAGVATCKHALDEAMAAIRSGGNTWSSPSASAASSPSTSEPSSPSPPASTASAPKAGSLSPSPATTATSPSSSERPLPLGRIGPPPPGDEAPSANEPSAAEIHAAQAQEERVQKGLEIAGRAVVDLISQRDKLTGTLTAAMLLIDALMGRMRATNVVPDPFCVAAKAKLDREMRILLAGGSDDPPSPPR